jgi:hypothetical protein
LTSGYVDGTFYDKITTNLIILFKWDRLYQTF